MSTAGAGPLRLGEKGVEIDGGSMGGFTLAYPRIATKAAPGKHETAIEQRLADGKMVLKYPCGVLVNVSLGQDGKVVYRFSGKLDLVAHFRVGELLVPPNYMDGGTWRIGDGDAKPFPAEKPATPFLYQGKATRFEFSSVDGKRIRVDLPPYSYQQLQDNREWNWNVFAWWFHSPFDKNKAEYVVTVTLDAGDGKNVVLVDRFGQTTRKEFPGRVASLDELKSDVRSEDAYYASLRPAKLDAFGGLPGSGENLGLHKTGFFHLQRSDDRWILVDPIGNAFFHLGICGFGCGDDYTYIEGRESAYDWLPPRASEFGAAYHPEAWWNPRAFSFYKANVIRKYGPFDEEAFLARMVRRVRQAGLRVDPEFVRRIYEWSGQRPQMWSEFFYTAEEESNVSGRLDVATQRDRGLAYRNYVENAAALGFVVGTEWFTLIDQAVTGRFFEKYNGERQNTGLFNVCDRPYRDALAGMAASHRRIYDVWLNGEPPYVFEHPRFTGGQGESVRTVRAGHSVGPMIVDGQLTGWPGRPPERITPDRFTVGRDGK